MGRQFDMDTGIRYNSAEKSAGCIAAGVVGVLLTALIGGEIKYNVAKSRCDADPVCVAERETKKLARQLDSLRAVHTADSIKAHKDSIANAEIKKEVEKQKQIQDSIKREMKLFYRDEQGVEREF